jgi:hypothetical protein
MSASEVADLRQKVKDYEKQVSEFEGELALMVKIEDELADVKKENERLRKEMKKTPKAGGGAGDIYDLQNEIDNLKRQLVKERDAVLNQQRENRELEDKNKVLDDQYRAARDSEMKLKDEKVKHVEQVKMEEGNI